MSIETDAFVSTYSARLHFNDVACILKASTLCISCHCLKRAMEIRLFQRHLEKELKVVQDLWGVLSLFRAGEVLYILPFVEIKIQIPLVAERVLCSAFMDSSSSSYFSVQNSIGRTQRETHHPKNLLLLLYAYMQLLKNIEQKRVMMP